LCETLRSPQPELVLLWPLGLDGRQRAPVECLLAAYRSALRSLGLEVDEKSSKPEHGTQILLVQGPHALPLLEPEAGLQLFSPGHGAVEPVRLLVLPVAEGAEPAEVLQTWLARRQEWLAAVGRGEARVEDDPLSPGPVLRIHTARDEIIDLRTGLTGPDLAACLLAALPLPAEISSTEKDNP
jgi:hypothetical protein